MVLCCVTCKVCANLFHSSGCGTASCSPTSYTQILPQSSPAATWRPLWVQVTRLSAAPPSTVTLALATSVSLLRFQRSSRPVPSTAAKRAGCCGDQAQSYT